MPAQVVLVHDDPSFSEPAARALRAAGYEVLVFPDPLVALDALESAACVELLITRVQFPVGRSNGAALALMLRRKRPGVQVMLLSRPEFVDDVMDLGTVVTYPVTVAELVEKAQTMMRNLAHDRAAVSESTEPSLEQNGSDG